MRHRDLESFLISFITGMCIGLMLLFLAYHFMQ